MSYFPSLSNYWPAKGTPRCEAAKKNRENRLRNKHRH